MAEYPDNLPVCWWTPAGYETAALPPSFVQACKMDNDQQDWNADMRSAGYEALDSNDPEGSSYGVKAWRYRATRPHLLVELWDFNGQLAVMCVEWRYQAAFLFDKWPALLRNQRGIEEASPTKAIIAFIRHGHGESTINEEGTENFEERQARLDLQAHRKAQRDKAKKAAAPCSSCNPIR